MTRPVVLVAEDISADAVATLSADFDVRHVDGTDRDALLAAVPDAEAIMVRSETRLDAEVIDAAPRLKIIARVGVSLDNIEVRAATLAGVMVVNAPTSNLVSAAELSIGLLLAVARNISLADRAVRSGSWDRAALTGVELAGRTLGVLGLGRVGILVAQRMQGFGMHVMAYDPYVSQARAAQIGVRLSTLDEVLRQSDFLTIHMPRTGETTALIGEEALKLVKPTVRIVSASRTGIVDENALYVALQEGRVAGVGVDIFLDDPFPQSPLFGLDTVVSTPHLGSSTAEAQAKAGESAARSVRQALAGELVPDAVNVQGGAIAEEVRPAIPLAERLGQIFTAVAGGAAVNLDVEVRGDLVRHDVKVVELAALKGVFTGVVEHPVSYVNAPVIAADRGVEVRLIVSEEPADHRNLVTLRGRLGDGTQVSVSGTVAGPRRVHKLVEVKGFDVDVHLSDHLLVLQYGDHPGVVSILGRVLGDAEVSISSLQVVSRGQGREVLAVLTVDSAVPQAAVDQLACEVGADSVRAVDLTQT